ncbi:MAG: UDP-N-acetylmuramoyl-L-alanyl-D-glutamate--2,6-diaminopimelate ligase [Actinomycetota bacterium]|nr:UDP-N-acetylmuramoyl-L-alanyl-D-glutamate--2,6-diaminopimelate ligase [Actinomycetota bacterium]
MRFGASRSLQAEDGGDAVRRLSELAEAVDHLARAGDAVVTGITEDSRQVRPGWLFVARRGGQADGHRFVDDALRRGAAALVVEHPQAASAPQLVVPNTSAAVGPLAAAFYGHPSRQLSVVGVTGTNGKTTTCELIRAAIEATGRPAGQIGTIATRVGRQSEPATMTTPSPTDLQRHLFRMVQAGVGAVAMEVSSHALDQYRVDGTEFAVGVFTNLDTEHLDYHGTLEQYWASKARLFEPGRCRQALVCIDSDWGVRLAHQVAVPVRTFSAGPGADVRYSVEDLGLDGSIIHLAGDDVDVTIPTRMVGAVNAPNVAGAFLAARELGVPSTTVVDALAACPRPPGRFELVDEGQPFLVVVDYAHTPEALTSLVSTARRCAGPDGRIRVVVGARGGRDRFKRPRTGAAAAAAGPVVLTTDSPGDEDPWSIIEQLRLGTVEVAGAEVAVEPDRRRAITMAIDAAAPGDVVLIVGRGHEEVQHIGGRAIPLDDRQVAHAALALRRSGRHDGVASAGTHPPMAVAAPPERGTTAP